MILILNPTVKTHWIYRRFFEEMGVPDGFQRGQRQRVLYPHHVSRCFGLRASRLLTRDRVDEAEQSSPSTSTSCLEGGLRKADGVILNNWHFGAFDHTLPYGFGLDFGYRDPDALVRVAIDKKQKKVYLRQELYKNGLSTGDLARQTKTIVGNNLVIGDSAASRSIEDLKGYWVNIKPVIKGKINEDIKMMQDWELIIDPNSTDLAKELNNWVWLDKAGEIPLDGFQPPY